MEEMEVCDIMKKTQRNFKMRSLYNEMGSLCNDTGSLYNEEKLQSG